MVSFVNELRLFLQDLFTWMMCLAAWGPIFISVFNMVFSVFFGGPMDARNINDFNFFWSLSFCVARRRRSIVFFL